MKKKRGINLCIGWSPTSKTGKTVYVLAGCLKGRVLFSYSATEELCFRIWVLILDFSYPGTDRRSYERRSQEGRGEKETFFFKFFTFLFGAGGEWCRLCDGSAKTTEFRYGFPNGRARRVRHRRSERSVYNRCIIIIIIVISR